MGYRTVNTIRNNYDAIHEERFGAFNDTPPGFEQITDSEFAKSHFYKVVSPSKIEFRQFYPMVNVVDDKGRNVKLGNAHLFYDETGNSGVVMLASEYPENKMYYFKFDWKYVHPCNLVSDSGWTMDSSSSRPSRGIMDYNRILTFERNLSPSEIEDVRYWLLNDNCPGWTGIYISGLGNGSYTCRTTHDSSD